MADPVGFTASVIGIATLAVQLGDALRKAAEFWEAVQDAPSDIRRLSKELRLVASVFHTIQIEYETGSTPTNFESMVKDALELAKDDIDQLSEFISELSRNLSVSNGSLGRQWRKVQMVLKASKIERFRDNLESVKTTMALLQGSRQQASLIQVSSRLDVLSTNISSIATTNSTHQIALQASQEMTQSSFVPSSGWKDSAGSVSRSFDQYKTSFLLGTLNFRTISTTHRYSDDDGTDDADNSTTTKTFLIELFMGFTTCRKRFRFMMSSNFDQYALDVVRRRPNNSEIFRLCKRGNVQGVKKLLDRGEASIHDINEKGESLLHKAVFAADTQLCTMLLDLGADVYWEDDYGIVPISRALALTSFAAISEAGYDLWPLCTLSSGLPFYNILNISIWRYVFQHKPAGSIGRHWSVAVLWSLNGARDAEVVDFLAARVAEELFQFKIFTPSKSGKFLERIILQFIDRWLGSLFRLWFYGEDKHRVFLFEYKLFVILERIYIPWVLRNSNEELLSCITTGIYMDGVVKIIKACNWSMEITNAIFRIWSQPFLELGIDLISHHPCTIRGNGENNDGEDSDWEDSDGEDNDGEDGDKGENSDGEDSDSEDSDGEDSDKESTANPALRWHVIDCCRDICCEITHEDQLDNLSLNITRFTRPEYSHLDPQFLCEAGRMRGDLTGAGRCLSRTDEAFIKDGKFSMDVPGQWEEPPVPNTTMGLVLHSITFELPQIRYSMIHGPESDYYKAITEEDIQQIEQDLRNGTLYGLSEDLPETSRKE
ncbi:uncharacterized protein Bfra_009701 [Botrytis fragariae]|uniref:Azaphilone pigments biosynthesis cluster protein L N-terminal domain-containing protein n=1 Tax=Botrytis fragariae TaxID=1964551 RepID=A0A8H6EFG9_9HELO|nr:uncharacterized protein Bfra_009701 [Botrytis fragariae]KAF5870317.1 hypothetical protein Bfra_009701 [Botrytis fragariae]